MKEQRDEKLLPEALFSYIGLFLGWMVFAGVNSLDAVSGFYRRLRNSRSKNPA